MADNDIYNNEERYKSFKANIEKYLTPPTTNDKEGDKRKDLDRKRKYWIKNKANLKHYKTLFTKFDARDLSYIRRLRLLRTFLIVTYVLEIEVSKATRDDIDKVMAYAHTVNKTNKSKQSFALDVKYLWKQLFPETDEKGRADDTIFPYAVRNLSGKIDKSKEKLRGDKFSLEEFENLVQSFSNDPRMQALLTVSLESLGRPQELLHRKIKDVEVFDNYAKIYITEHGKEGTGFLRVVDSYSYLTKWLNAHPMRSNKNAFLFINTGRVNRYKQMTPFAANKLIRERCKALEIEKPITLYSLKRNGVTMMRLQGKSDLDIQHTARWTSTKQLQTYDLSSQEDSFKIELIKRGKIPADKGYEAYKPKIKTCLFCGLENGLAESMCSNCKRPLDRKVIEQENKRMEDRLEAMELKLLELDSKYLKAADMDRQKKKVQKNG